MFCSYRCCFTNKMTAGETESENNVSRICFQNVLIYNNKASQHAFWNTSYKASYSPQTTCIAHVEMNHCCPWKPCMLELVESCAVSGPKGLLSVKHPPTKSTGPLESFATSQVFLLSKQNKLLSSSPRDWDPPCSLCLQSLMHMWAFSPKALLEVWDFLWNKICNLRGSTLTLGGTGLLGGCFTPNSRSLSVRDLKTDGRLTGIYPVNNIWRERSRQNVDIFNSSLLILWNRHDCNE